MDSGVVHSRVHEDDEHHPHNVGLQQEEQHHDHEKKSVLKKVKAKAKKIKGTIMKHGHHDHDQDHEFHYEDQHIPDDHDLDEEDDEDEEMVEDAEVHGAPIYESAAARCVIPAGEQPHHEPKVVVVSPNTEPYQNKANDSTKTFAGEGKVNMQTPIGLEEDPQAPGTRLQAHTAPNYQTKISDPTGAGAAEIDVTPVEKSLAKMDVHDEPKVLSSSATPYPYDTVRRNEEHRHYESMDKPSNQSSYTDKLSSATSAIADKAITAKNVITSKLGYGGGDNATATQEDHSKSEDANAFSTSGTSTTEYGKKIAGSITEKLAPVYGKVAGVGSAVKSKVSGTKNGADKGVSVKEYLAEKLTPGDEDRALSEVISEALHKRKEEPMAASGDEERSKVISDAIHKRDDDPEKTEHRRLGKVTESEEVKRRLGSTEEKKGSGQSNMNSSEKGVVDKLKDMAGSWFGKIEDNQSSQESGRVNQGERRLQESSN